MSDSPCLVTVITATRNRPALLAEALRSIAAQTYPSFECLVIDDRSDPSVFAQYEELWTELDERFVLHKRIKPSDKGGTPGASRNRGIQLARGEYVAFLDDDDRWICADHLSAGVEAMRRHDADYYFANMRGHRDGQVVPLHWTPNSPELTRGKLVHEEPRIYDVPLPQLQDVMRRRVIHPNSCIVRRDLLRRVGGFLEGNWIHEDWNLAIRLADGARRILYRPDCVVSYRLPEGDAISLRATSIEWILDDLTAAQHARAQCRHRRVRRWVRSREGWALRELAQQLQKDRRPDAALSFAWQALCLYPTLGGTAFFARSLLGALTARFTARCDIS